MEKAGCWGGFSRAWEAFIKMLIALPSWHISMGQDPRLCHSLVLLSACHNHQFSPSHNSLFRYSAPSPQSPAQALSDFIRCLLSQAFLYLPCVTKLLDASDKGRNPGMPTCRITSLAVCLSLIFTPTGSQSITPASHEGTCDLFLFSPNAVRGQLVSWALPIVPSFSHLQLPRLPNVPWAA